MVKLKVILLYFLGQYCVYLIHEPDYRKPLTFLRTSFWVEDTTIKEKINLLIQQINKDVINGQKVSKDIYNQQVEAEAKTIYRHGSSVVTAFYKMGKIKKISSLYQGDRQTLESSYYFDNANLVFVKKKMTIYNPPKWEPHSKIEKVQISDFYFHNKKLVIAEYSSKKTSKELSVIQNQLVKEALTYRSIMAK